MNKKEKMHYGRWLNFMRTVMIPKAPSIEVEFYCINNCIEVYNKFYKWMHENCNKDKSDVLEKKLEYLEDCYEELLKKIENRRTDKNANAKLMEFSRKNEKIFKTYIEDNKQEYYSFYQNKNKQYKYYNNLCSWYDIVIDGTDEVVDNLYKLSKSYNDNIEPYSHSYETQSGFVKYKVTLEKEKVVLVGEY